MHKQIKQITKEITLMTKFNNYNNEIDYSINNPNYNNYSK